MYRSRDNPNQAHSVQATINRDFERMRKLRKREVQHEKDLKDLERRWNATLKWEERCNYKLLGQISQSTGAERPSTTLEEFMVHERVRYDKIMNSKKIANEQIRRR